MNNDRWRMGFHLMPPTGWVNDPNGLCQFRGIYRLYCQYSPDWPEPDAERGWLQFESTDLLHWSCVGWAIHQDIPEDASGAYSGSALVVPGAASDGGDLLRLYYTGNVKEPGNHDYIHSGRQANVILVETEDARSYSSKRVLLRNADYPAYCSCHVRDPNLWREADGNLRMILGARDLDDHGCALVYASKDGIAWEHAATVRSAEPFGYMWECPGRIALDGHEYLSCCPQGLQDLPWANGIRDQSGYFELDPDQRLFEGPVVDAADFRRWDAGFDFYAPQAFVDDSGRTLFVGWMGLPEPPFGSAPGGLTWIHCLTVPRELSRLPDGVIAQTPTRELVQLRGEGVDIKPNAEALMDEHRADLCIEGIEGPLELVLDDALSISCADGAVRLAFVNGEDAPEGVGASRSVREADSGPVRNLRVLIDSSAIEVYANDGRTVLSTRWFPRRGRLSLRLQGACAHARAWAMTDALETTYPMT